MHNSISTAESNGKTWKRGAPRLLKSQHSPSDVLRDLVVDIMDDAGLSETQFAKRIGHSQSGFSRFMTGTGDCNITLLAKVAHYEGVTPVELLARHRVYGGKKAQPVRDTAYAALERLLQPGEATMLGIVLAEAKRSGNFDAVIATIGEALRASGASSSAPTSIRAARGRRS
jgi:hypothetical protein